MPSFRRRKPRENVLETLVKSSALTIGGRIVNQALNMSQYSTTVTPTIRHHAAKNPRPTCTHVTMDRVFDPDRKCEQCCQRPFLGVLYVCRQDERMKDLEFSISPTSMDSGVDFRAPSTPRSVLREELEDIGLSNSVIKLAENGFYTPDQLDTIKAQKIHVTQIIEEQQQKKRSKKKKHSAASSISKTSSDNATISVDTSSTVSETSSNTTTENTSRKLHRKRTKATRRKHDPPCKMAYCVRCRPYYRDRMYMSIESAIKGEYPRISEDEMSQLRVINSKKLRGIGLLIPPYRPGHIGEQDEDDDDQSTHASLMTANSTLSETLPPSTSDVSGLTRLQSKSVTDFASTSTESVSRHSRRPGMRALRLFRLGRPASRDTVVTDALSTSSTVEESPVKVTAHTIAKKISSTTTDDELDRSMWHDAFDDVDLEPTFDVGTDGPSVPHGFLPLSSHPVYPKSDVNAADAQSVTSSVSDEIEVEGGLALTEEAVETLTPDIITQV